jgi:hypothetical protein
MRLALADIEIDGTTYRVEHAQVETYRLEREDHGILTVNLSFKGESWGQGMPAMGLDEYDKEQERRVGTAFGCEYIGQIVDRLGSPGKVGQAVVVLRTGHFIDGFATVRPDGSLGEPFITKRLVERYFPERVHA